MTGSLYFVKTADMCGQSIFVLDFYMIGIYLIVNMINNKLYVGSSLDIDRRWSMHISYLNNGKHENEYLQNAWNKHGQINFKFYILEITSSVELLIREQHWIDKLKVTDRKIGYNLCPIATSVKGIKRSAETRARMSAWQFGRKLPENIKLKMRKPKVNKLNMKGNKPWLGKKHSEETKIKMSLAQKARSPFSEETRRKMSESRLAYFERRASVN